MYVLQSFLLFAVIFSSSATHDSTCYSQQLTYRIRTGTRVVYFTESYYESCGSWWGRRRCHRTRQASRSETYTYSVPAYFQQFQCCSGYRARSGGGCEPICVPACQNGGICTHPNTCQCSGEYTGSTCQTPVCVPDCDHGTCTSPQTCTCDAGYTGSRCRLDIPECADGNNGGCDHICTNTIGSFECSCREGFELSSNQRTCDDVDECLVNNGGCVQLCINLVGSYQCACNIGYEFDSLPEGTLPTPTNAGRACIDTNECDRNNGGCGQVCSNTVGSFECSCNSGYQLLRDGQQCGDIDECATGTHNCSGLAQCVNEVGFFQCECPEGYRLDDTRTSCIDIDECAEGTSGCSQQCNNTIGSFECSCVDGYRLALDGKICNDINECTTSGNMGGCEYFCINTVGSYYCDCPTGFTLSEDERTCKAKECPSLSRPRNGTISCTPSDKQTTGDVCAFDCDGGFKRQGSRNRVCQGDSWTGSRAVCDPYECDRLEAPTNGALLFPCDQEYGTSCSVLCTFGFMLQGSSKQSCVLVDGSRTEVEWTDPPVCIESNPCQPNPCLNGGSCTRKNQVELSDQSFECNCQGTGFEGSTCERGVVEVPSIPTLSYRQPQTFAISARPEMDMGVNIEGDGLLLVSPSSVTLSRSAPTAQISVTGLRLGQYSLHYTLTGPIADSFDTPEDSRVFVGPAQRRSNEINAYFRSIKNTVGFLNESCCMSKFAYPECPMTTDAVTFISTCLWTADSNTYATNGIVFARFKSLSIPVSVSGIEINYNMGTIDTSVPEASSCRACEENANKLVTPQQSAVPEGFENCYFYSIQPGDIADFLASYALANTYINRISPLIPTWIGVQLLRPTSTNTPSFNDGDFSTALVEQTDVSSIDGCESLQPTSPGLYSVLTYAGSQQLELRVNEETKVHDVRKETVCVAVNLCQEMESPLHAQLPQGVQSTISKLTLLKPYEEAGWDYSLDTVTFYPMKRSVSVSGMYWNGTSMYAPYFPGADMEIGTFIYPSFSSSKEGYVRMKADPFGELGLLSLNVESSEIRHGIFSGGLSIELNIEIEKDINSLMLISSSSIIYYTSAENSPSICNQGVSIPAKYIPRASQHFFSQLFSLSEETPECDMPLFINFDHSLEFQGMSMHLNAGCPRLRFDRLVFPQMIHTLYFTESSDFRSQCVWKPDVDLGVSDPTLSIRSTLRQISRVPLGSFLTLLPGEDSLALSAAFPPGDDQRKVKLHSVDASLLGTIFNTEIDIEEGMLSFTADTNVYGEYAAQLTVSAPTNVPWERMVLTVEGEMSDSTVGEIDQYIKNYVLEDIINKGLERERNGRQAIIRANQTLTMLTAQLRVRERQLEEAKANYEQALETSRIANETLRNATSGVDTANAEVLQAQSALNQVCREDSCIDIGIEREICQTCYQDILSEEPGECTVLRPQEMNFEELVGYMTRRRWEYQTICENYCYRVCGWFTSYTRCRTRCRGKCVSVPYSVPIIERVQRTVLVPETESCDPPMQVLEQSIPMSCCQSYIERSPDVQCREMCRSAQVQATQRLNEVNREAAEPFERLNEAREAALAANTRLARARIQRDNAQLMRDQIIQPYQSAQIAIQVSLVNQQRLTAEVRNELRIARQYETVGIEGVVTINGIEFTTEISTESPTTIPLRFSYTSFGRQFTRVIAIDFTASKQLNQRQIAEEIAADILNTTSRMSRRSTVRFRRQAGDDSEVAERSRNEEEFQSNCVLRANIQQYIQNILNSLQMIEDSNTMATNMLQQSKENLEQQAMRDMMDMNMINFDALENLFNITRDDLRDDSNEEIIDEYSNYFEDLANTTGELIDSIDANSFIEWQASMEMLHNETGSAAGYPCTGFADCLDIITDLMKRLITDLRPGADKQALRQQFDQNRQRFVELATSMTLKVPGALSVARRMLETVNNEILSAYWCSAPPNITDQPPMQVNVSSTTDLTLECEYLSTLPVSAHWRKDGAPIPNSNSSTLTLTNLNIMDGGNYTCHVSNAVGSRSSLNVSVLVYELPQFFQVLMPVTTYAGNESGAWFSCNASAWPFPGWRWYYRAQESDPWIQFEGEDTNELTISTPQKENEGWYTCEAFNYHGYLRAPPVRLTILPVSVAPLGLEINFQLTSNGSKACTDLDSLRQSIDTYIRDTIKIGSASIGEVEIEAATLSTYNVEITLISENITTEDTKNTILREIENMALPSRGDVINARRALQQAAINEGVSFSCRDVQLSLQASSLTFETLEYFCPPGQELNSNFLLCVGCPRGTYQTVRSGERVFNGEGIKESYPVCRVCPVSSYQDQVASTDCKICPEYYQTRGPGSTSREDCYVDPLLLQCETGGSTTQVSIDCRVSRPLSGTFCSFDGGPQHKCEWPMFINIQSGLSPGNHSVVITARDIIGLTADATLTYLLENEEQSRLNLGALVPRIGIQFINNSPRVENNTVEVDFALTRPTTKVTCRLNKEQNTDCSSGSVRYTNLEPGRYTFRVAAGQGRDEKGIERRYFEIPSDDTSCTTHLINDGVVIGFGGQVTVEFASVGPAVEFMCRLDGQERFLCSSPIELTVEEVGDHVLKIIPQGCEKQRTQTIKFTIE